MRFLDTLRSRALLFDGAMSTLLKETGLVAAGDCPELLSLTHPLDMMDIHSAYLSAGADVITANTFGANPHRLCVFGLSERMNEIVQSAVAICKEATSGVNRPVYVAASLGPTGLLPSREPAYCEEAYKGYYAQCAAAAAAGADAIIIETMSDLREGRLALLAARAACRLPVLAGFTLEADDSTFAGNPPEVLALSCAKLGAAMAGVNCGLGPEELFNGFSRLSAASALPVFALPNAAHKQAGGHYAFGAEAFARAMAPYLQGGARAVGGCCGAGPAHIKALRPVVDENQGSARIPGYQEEYICSSGKRLPLTAAESLPAPIPVEDMSPEAVREAVLALAREHAAVELALGSLSPLAIRDLLWELLPSLTGTPLVFSLHTADQANAALLQYPGIAAVRALSDAYRVLKVAARFGAEVLA